MLLAQLVKVVMVVLVVYQTLLVANQVQNNVHQVEMQYKHVLLMGGKPRIVTVIPPVVLMVKVVQLVKPWYVELPELDNALQMEAQFKPA